ncbi:MAG TPA: Cpe/LpqF family protein, partial [Polyangiaceae bacterium]|nr:Cpe/LpqF family protein [Polyangiaceae bacterium]
MIDGYVWAPRSQRSIIIAIALACAGVACSDSDKATEPDAGLGGSSGGNDSGGNAPDAGGGRPSEASSPDAGSEPEGLAPPDTAVGRQLAWLLDVINERGGEVDEPELREHFSSGFLDAVPPIALQQTFAAIAEDGAPLVLLVLSPQNTDTTLEALVDAQGTQLVISLSLEAGTGLIQGLLFDEPVDLESGRPTSWDAVEANIAALAPRSSYLVASVTGNECTPLHAAASDERLGLGSAFKLYVLGELSRQIEAGTLGWDTAISVRDELKSLPSGQLQ